MAIELLTPFTKVKLEPEVKAKKKKASWDFRWKLQSSP